MTVRRSFPFLAALLLAVSFPQPASPAEPFAPLSGMARLEAEDRLDASGASSLVRGYLSFGLGREAAASLERRIRLAEFPRDAAASLFDRIVADRSVREDPAQLVAVCEMAARNGVESPLLSYSRGSGLRRMGRLAEAAEVLSRIGPDHPYHLHALFALGQISVEREDFGSGRELFRKVAETRNSSPDRLLSPRAARAETEVLLLAGRAPEVSRLLEDHPRESPDFIERVVAASAARDPSSALEAIPASSIAGQPVRTKALFLLLKGGIAREQGRFASAIADLSRADEEVGASLSRESSPPSASSHRGEAVKPAELLIAAQKSARERLANRVPEDAAAFRDQAVELLIDLLFLDRYVSEATEAGSPSGMSSELPARTSGEVESILKRIERLVLDGLEQTATALKWDSVFWDIDRFASELDDQAAELPRLGHPMQRRRLLVRIEKSHAEVHRSRERLRRRREADIGGSGSGRGTAITAFLRDFGLYLKDLDGLRAALGDAREFTRTNARMLRQKRQLEASSRKAMEDLARDTLEFSNDRMAALLPSIREHEERTRAARMERERRDLAALRPMIRRQLADAFVAQARSLLGVPREEAQREFRTAVENAASLLVHGDLTRPDQVDTAIHVGSLLAGSLARRVTPAGGNAGEREKILIASILPVLEMAARTESRREESLSLIAILRLTSREEGALFSARSFLERFPASRFAGDIAVRLGHEALAAGDAARAESYYRMASGAGNPAAAAIARHMTGWLRYRDGDSAGALEEWGTLLSDPSFACGDPGPFEKEVLSSSVRALRESLSGALASFPPVGQGTCGGRRILLLLGESEAGRGNSAGAVEAYDLLARRFPDDEAAPSWERKGIEELMRAGRDREALSRALPLWERYRGDSAWAGSRPSSVREKAESDLAGLLKNLSDRMFSEGIRSGDRSAMSLAAAGIERYVALTENDPGGADREMLLKWAIASLRAGNREAAVGLLLELMGEGRHDEVGERAALLYAETMIAGYERRELAAEDAEEAAYLLLGDDPSERAAALAFRAASDFLGAEDYERAEGIAEAVETCRSATQSLRARARLIRAESSYFRGETTAAIRLAGSVLEQAGADASPDLLPRAKELYLLAVHKEIEGKMASRDWYGAGEMLEQVGGRFLDRSEAPLYYLNALRSYRQAGREDAALRVGLRFLGEFPGREESVEVVGAVGPYLQARKEFSRAADLYEKVAEAFPGNSMAPRFLFHAARLSESIGHRDAAVARFSACRSRYPEPRWMSAYAALAIGAMKRMEGDAKTAIREMEEGVRLVTAGLEPDAPGELIEMAGRARIAIGENWAEQFRKTKLVLPLERSLAVKERFFRQALAAFEAAGADAPLEVAVVAARSSADLLVEFGTSILESQRPKGMNGSERARYEEALKRRARALFERAFARYAEAFDLLESEKGTPDLAAPIRERLENVQALLSMASAPEQEESR